MRTKVLIKRFDADESERSRWVLGDLRLYPPRNGIDTKGYITLEAAPSGDFPLTPNLSAETWTTRPRAVKRWIAFQARAEHVKLPGESEPVTSARYKLGDEFQWYFWDGAAWIVDGSAWNTEAEISENIASFPVTARSLRIRVNLQTTNPKYAPRLFGINVAFEAAFDHMDDYVLRSLTRFLKTIRPLGRVEVKAGDAGQVFTVRLDAPYTIRDGSSAFTLLSDPDELNDIFDSWSPGVNAQTGTLNTTEIVPGNRPVMFYFEHEPIVAHTTGVDYFEANASPAIALTKIEETDRGYGADDHAINVHDQRGVKVFAPRQVDIVVSIEITTSKQWDIWQISKCLKELLATGAKLRSYAMDEEFSLWVHDPLESQGTRGNRDLYRATMGLTIQMAVLYERDHVEAFGVKAFKATGDANFEV